MSSTLHFRASFPILALQHLEVPPVPHPVRLVPPYIETLEPYKPGKPIRELQRETGLTSIVKLASNENPLGPSPKALAALRRALASVHRYPDSAGHELTRKLAVRFRLDPGQIEALYVGNFSGELFEGQGQLAPILADWCGLTPRWKWAHRPSRSQ